MTKVFNSKLANTEVTFSFGKVVFDLDGIADIEPDENAQLAVGVHGFRIVDEEFLQRLEDAKKVPEVKITAPEEAKKKAESTEPIVPDFIKDAEEKAKQELADRVSALSDKQKGDEIDAVAKELNFEYPEEVNTKAEKVKAIKAFFATK